MEQNGWNMDSLIFNSIFKNFKSTEIKQVELLSKL